MIDRQFQSGQQLYSDFLAKHHHGGQIQPQQGVSTPPKHQKRAKTTNVRFSQY